MGGFFVFGQASFYSSGNLAIQIIVQKQMIEVTIATHKWLGKR